MGVRAARTLPRQIVRHQHCRVDHSARRARRGVAAATGARSAGSAVPRRQRSQRCARHRAHSRIQRNLRIEAAVRVDVLDACADACAHDGQRGESAHRRLVRLGHGQRTTTRSVRQPDGTELERPARSDDQQGAAHVPCRWRHCGHPRDRADARRSHRSGRGQRANLGRFSEPVQGRRTSLLCPRPCVLAVVGCATGLAQLKRAERVDHHRQLVEVLDTQRPLDGAWLRAMRMAAGV